MASTAANTSPARGAPVSLSDWIASRLERISEEAGRVAMLASLFGRSVILLPSTLLRGLTPLQQAAIITHELAHCMRKLPRREWLAK